MTDDDTDVHREKMVRRKEAFDARKARATIEKGLIVVNTGNGKGKTTAALGIAFRALGHGMKVGIVQFIKGAIATGEAALVARLGLPIAMHTLGDGFTWNTQDRDRDVATARRGWEQAVSLLRDPSFGVVILDELNVVVELRLSAARRGARRAEGEAAGAARRRHRAQREAGADRTGRPGDGDEAREASVSGAGREAATGDRVLMETSAKPSIVLVGHGSRDPQATAEFRRVVAGLAALDPERDRRVRLPRVRASR